MAEILDNVRRVHFIGIGGIGMLALAQYLHAIGLAVSGSDATDSDLLQALRALGMEVHIGHDPRNVGNVDLVVFTAAAGTDNVELVEATNRGIPTVKRAELLGRICDQGPSLAIAGTHGKTTTTALSGHLVRAAGVDATIFAGGLTQTSSGGSFGPALIGSQDVFVVEADEYDRSFLQLRPDIAVITNLEYDHPDCYDSLESMVDAYVSFLGNTTSRVIISARAANARRLTESIGVPFETFGTSTADSWSAGDIEFSPAGSFFTLTHNGMSCGSFTIRLLGLHNVENAVGAIAAAGTFTGAAAEELQQAVATFAGTARRLQILGSVGDITVLDDYAHHPTEIRATLAALSVLDGPVRVIFQPHTYSRTQAFLNEFANSFGLASEVVLLPVYGAREVPIPGVDSEALAAELTGIGTKTTLFDEHDEAVDYVARTAKKGDLVVTMGAGTVTALGPEILKELNGEPLSVA